MVLIVNKERILNSFVREQNTEESSKVKELFKEFAKFYSRLERKQARSL